MSGWSKEPDASPGQMRLIEILLRQLGYAHPRNDPGARRDYGWNQRQAKGKFTVSEASELIDRLRADVEKRDAEIDPSEIA